MISKVMTSYLFLVIFLVYYAQTKFTDVPPPPTRPDHFHSKEELKKYLQKVHEYYLILGRWRLRRQIDSQSSLSSSSEDDLFQFFDINHDQQISPKEFLRRFKFHDID